MGENGVEAQHNTYEYTQPAAITNFQILTVSKWGGRIRGSRHNCACADVLSDPLVGKKTQEKHNGRN